MPGAGNWTDSTAYTVDSNGVIYGTADGTLYGVSGAYAIEWFPTVGWSAAVSGNWSSLGSWTPPAVPAGSLGATFNTGSATPYTVTLTGAASPQSLTVQDNVTIQKAGFNLTASGSATIAGTSGNMDADALRRRRTDDGRDAEHQQLWPASLMSPTI